MLQGTISANLLGIFLNFMTYFSILSKKYQKKIQILHSKHISILLYLRLLMKI